MIDAMDELKRKLNRMSSNSSYAEVSDSDYLDVLTELYEQLKYAQERIVQLEDAVQKANFNHAFGSQETL